ncbi:MAG: hypothetical protein WC841_05260 [Candidatus Shapirobacteria bacterium]|jgi:hypothetical protein
MSIDRSSDTQGLPFDLNHHHNTTESKSTNVYLPDSGQGVVVKVAKDNFWDHTPHQAWNEAKKLRTLEELTLRTAGEQARQSIVAQSYLVVGGTAPGTSRIARIQQFVEGTPLNKLGLKGILSLPPADITQLRCILFDSMKCYLRYGVNYDLIGRDESVPDKMSLLFIVDRAVFSLRHSNNLFKTQEGIKLIDPNTPGTEKGEKSLTNKALQGILFVSAATNYLLLSVRQFFHH